MLQPTDNQPNTLKSQYFTNQNSQATSTVSVPVEQATIGRSLVIKGELSGAEALYIDGRVEGKINVPDHRVTIGRNGNVTAINAREVIVMGKVYGNVQCSDRIEVRSEGSLIGDVITQRISVEEGALLKGNVEVRAAEPKTDRTYNQVPSKPVASETAKAASATAGSA